MTGLPGKTARLGGRVGKRDLDGEVAGLRFPVGERAGGEPAERARELRRGVGVERRQEDDGAGCHRSSRVETKLRCVKLPGRWPAAGSLDTRTRSRLRNLTVETDEAEVQPRIQSRGRRPGDGP